MLFFNSFPGHYLTQVIVYSLVVITITETLLATWRIREPMSQIRFRFLALLLPLLCPLLFLWLYPPRGDFYFREQVAFIDLNTWLGMGGTFAVWYFFAAMMAITTGVFLVRESLPIIKHYLGPKVSFTAIKKGRFPRLDTALASFSENTPVPLPTVCYSPEEMSTIYCSSRHGLVVSKTMIDLLDDDELQAVIGHEIAHLSQRMRWLNRALLVLRWLQFYNPLAGLVFRRIINDIEMLCDDTAVQLTGKRLPLTSGLLKISRSAAKTRLVGPDEGPAKQARTRLEDIANHNLVRERAQRLVQGAGGDIPYQGLRLSVTALGLAALLFFVV